MLHPCNLNRIAAHVPLGGFYQRRTPANRGPRRWPPSPRAEGWVAGLQMAALSMHGREDVDGFIRAFAGSNRFIMDYLLEEVLARQPEETQGFLPFPSAAPAAANLPTPSRFSSRLMRSLLSGPHHPVLCRQPQRVQ